GSRMLACAAMAIRDERKQQTRHALMEAALAMVAAGRSFPSLSLREVTRDAGVVPASFYRHFRDMDELGLALVDDTCQQL
ncbi:TetR family transcriptional regulator, partial [Mycobacterium tuberculosis]